MRPVHERAVIISTGDELMVGQLLDTNARWLAERLVEAGIMPVEHITVPDELGRLTAALRRAVATAPLVVMSGGLGPTDGDLTRAALAEVMGEELEVDAAAMESLRAMLTRRGRELSERQSRQAKRPRSAECLTNSAGTAPGLAAWVRVGDGGADVFCLPGPPGELRPMFEREVLPRLRPAAGRTIITRLLHVVGITEADAVTRLGGLTERDRAPLVGITASGGVLTVRVRLEGAGGRAEGERLVEGAEAQIRAALGDRVFAVGSGTGVEHLARTVLELLKARGQTLGTVESCTGGMLGEMLTAIPGSSAAFVGGVVTYANALKERIGVEIAVLQRHGAVSAETAVQMAERGREWLGADWAVSLTGIAGPDGGTTEKPVGTVHIGLMHAGRDHTHARHFVFTGDREDVRRWACVTALTMLYFALQGRDAGTPRLLWEIC
ncbi:MAG: competence/damage-inducible protein A [Phycisphaerales bacterium]